MTFLFFSVLFFFFLLVQWGLCKASNLNANTRIFHCVYNHRSFPGEVEFVILLTAD